MTCWTQSVSMATAQAGLRCNDRGVKWVYRQPANPSAMPAEFLAVASSSFMDMPAWMRARSNRALRRIC